VVTEPSELGTAGSNGYWAVFRQSPWALAMPIRHNPAANVLAMRVRMDDLMGKGIEVQQKERDKGSSGRSGTWHFEGGTTVDIGLQDCYKLALPFVILSRQPFTEMVDRPPLPIELHTHLSKGPSPHKCLLTNAIMTIGSVRSAYATANWDDALPHYHPAQIRIGASCEKKLRHIFNLIWISIWFKCCTALPFVLCYKVEPFAGEVLVGS
jgi:hypothetical protein